LRLRILASGAAVLGQIELLPGALVASSVMLHMPTLWWLRPVNSAERVGEHRAVVWKRLYFKPGFARRSEFGVGHAPPHDEGAPKPTSSIMISSTFGAPLGGSSGSIGG